jgi:hypothetical protein
LTQPWIWLSLDAALLGELRDRFLAGQVAADDLGLPLQASAGSAVKRRRCRDMVDLRSG